MKNIEVASYVTRDTILKLLSDEEIARVSTAEVAVALEEGAEYIDLQALDKGVRRAHGTHVVMGHVLPKQAVRDTTWKEILRKLSTR